MRLIDADELMHAVRNTITEQSNSIDWLNLINQQPTAYDVDKAVEQLHNLKKYSNPYDSYYEEANYRATEFDNSVTNKVIDDVIKIVKAGGIDEN